MYTRGEICLCMEINYFKVWYRLLRCFYFNDKLLTFHLEIKWKNTFVKCRGDQACNLLFNCWASREFTGTILRLVIRSGVKSSKLHFDEHTWRQRSDVLITIILRLRFFLICIQILIISFLHYFQLVQLRSMTDSDGEKMQDNYRPPCPLKGREVKATFSWAVRVVSHSLFQRRHCFIAMSSSVDF